MFNKNIIVINVFVINLYLITTSFWAGSRNNIKDRNLAAALPSQMSWLGRIVFNIKTVNYTIDVSWILIVGCVSYQAAMSPLPAI